MRKFVIGLLAFIGFLTLSGCQKTASPTYLKTPYTQNEFVMGTTCTLTIYDKGKKSALKERICHDSSRRRRGNFNPRRFGFG